jgi:hypothetical protein
MVQIERSATFSDVSEGAGSGRLSNGGNERNVRRTSLRLKGPRPERPPSAGAGPVV